MRFAKSGATALAAMGLILASSTAFSEEVVVNARVTQWDPMVVFIKPGDSVSWTNMAGHNSESIPELSPEGGDSWQSKMGENVTQTFTKEGIYIYKCAPHISEGMVGAIVVGEGKPANLDAVYASPENKGMIGRTLRKVKKELEAKGIN
jgi:pseudoazurin